MGGVVPVVVEVTGFVVVVVVFVFGTVTFEVGSIEPSPIGAVVVVFDVEIMLVLQEEDSVKDTSAALPITTPSSFMNSLRDNFMWPSCFFWSYLSPERGSRERGTTRPSLL